MPIFLMEILLLQMITKNAHKVVYKETSIKKVKKLAEYSNTRYYLTHFIR